VNDNPTVVVSDQLGIDAALRLLKRRVESHLTAVRVRRWAMTKGERRRAKWWRSAKRRQKMARLYARHEEDGR